jgi:RimJ/RimL family protein N-acetyltransferase
MRIRTQRLELTAADRDTWIALLDGVAGPSVAGYPTVGDLVMARLVVDGHLTAGEWGPWQIEERSTGLLVGGVGFKGAPDNAGVVEIGYGLAPEARGRGLATEAVVGLVEHAHARGARVIRAEIDADNAPSRGVVERAGFTQTEARDGITWWVRDLR